MGREGSMGFWRKRREEEEEEGGGDFLHPV
jgi:hypothetical protein